MEHTRRGLEFYGIFPEIKLDAESLDIEQLVLDFEFVSLSSHHCFY
ncbi:hypothetical protein FDUTEX481_03234 [Tolypothrix sp. PCC 7601]|nr:hypothetical protein [Tolypothrix sp. PCC 7712]EKE99043.1 hypothetical protein FDUTEX481_03234 [Tolypothrix sp. PCC 7601]UYD35709.1 hypothetical protein HG267_08130 [Tolypothrix sp. PCC 7601]